MNPAKLLLISDDTDDEKLITGQLTGHYPYVPVKYSRTSPLHKIDPTEFNLVLLAVTDIDTASEALLRVMKMAFMNAPVIPPFVALCSTSNSGKACMLAQDGIFDDFVVFKPWVDPNQVLFRIGRAVERGALAAANADFRRLAARGSHIADDLQQLTSTLEAGRQTLADTQARALDQTRQSISKGIKQLGREVAESTPAGAVTPTLPEAIKEKLATFESGQLEGILDKLAREHSYAVDNFVEQCSKDLEVRMEPVAGMQSICREVAPLVAIVDDDEGVADTVSGMLEAMELDTFVIRDSRGALQSIVSKKPDLALLDIDMPHVTGFEVLAQIRAQPCLADMPVIMLTGRASQDNVKESISRGAVDFIAKPFDYNNLQERVFRAMRKR